MTNKTKPNWGEKTHPMTPVAWSALESLLSGPAPVQSFNPGVRDRFYREEVPVVETVDLPSPFKTHKGREIPHFRLTDHGKKLLSERNTSSPGPFKKPTAPWNGGNKT